MFVAVGAGAASCGRSHRAPGSTPSSSASPPTASAPVAAPPSPSSAAGHPSGPLRFVAVGGGATPESTEISLEQDIELVAGTLPSPGAVLFAGGSGSLSVREEDPKPHGDGVLLALGQLFHPRVGRQSRYEAVRLDAARASMDNRVDLPTPEPAKMPILCPAQIGVKQSTALTPVRTGTVTRARRMAFGADVST